MIKDYADYLVANEFSRRFLVKYAIACAMKCNQDTRTLELLCLAEKWGNGDDNVTTYELTKASSLMRHEYTDRGAYAAYTAMCAADITDTQDPMQRTISTAYWVENILPNFNATEFLVDMIKKEFTEFEQVMMGIL